MRYQGPGERLRELREEHGLTLKDVEARSRRIAEAHQNPEFFFSAGRLSQIENSNSLPSLFKLASLSEIYQIRYDELLRLFGIELNQDGRLSSANSNLLLHSEKNSFYC